MRVDSSADHAGRGSCASNVATEAAVPAAAQAPEAQCTPAAPFLTPRAACDGE